MYIKVKGKSVNFGIISLLLPFVLNLVIAFRFQSVK